MKVEYIPPQSVNCGRGGAGGLGEAPLGLYTKSRKTRTFEMDVMSCTKYSLESLKTLHI